MHFDTENVWDDAVCEDGIVYFSSVVLDVPAHPDTDPLLGLIEKHGYDTYVETEEGLFAITFVDGRKVFVTQLQETF